VSGYCFAVLLLDDEQEIKEKIEIKNQIHKKCRDPHGILKQRFGLVLADFCQETT